MSDKDYELLERFIEGAKESYEKVENHSYIFPITISRAYQISKSIEKLLKEQPDIVRCKDCINRHDSINCRMYSEGMDIPDDWFCADGKRRLVNKNEV